MFSVSSTWLTVVLMFSNVCFACSCSRLERSCEYLRADAVFVGRVEATTGVKHLLEKDSWTSGYSMRFTVEEPLRGWKGTEVTVETGNGGGDCGTPLPPGRKFLIFAYRNDKDGKLWTGMCSGNQALDGGPGDAKILEEYRSLTQKRTASVFGAVSSSKTVWRDDDVADVQPKPMKDMVLRAKSERFTATTKTAADGSYEFNELPNGKYTITPDISKSLDFDHEYLDRYEADVSDGACVRVGFDLKPTTRIRGHLTVPAGFEKKSIEVVAIPTSLKKMNQFSGKSDFIDEGGRFDLWPLPPGDYYVGVNINSSPKTDVPFLPTYYPGVTKQSAATIVHVANGETKELELPLSIFATPRSVHFTATGLDGKPLRTIYVQLEDLRHPGDAASYVNVDLDEKGSGSLMTIYSEYSYHLHGSHWVGGQDWCAKPVVIPKGTKAVEANFIMDREARNCDIYEMDGLKR